MAIPLPAAKQHEGEYEDLLSLWSDLETALSLLLSSLTFVALQRRPRALLSILPPLLAGTAIAIRDVAPVSAQPAMAVGQPLPDDKLEARTVMVRVGPSAS